MSIVATFYPSNREWLIGVFEAAIGAGMMLGPFIGTVLWAWGGYVFMNLVIGGIFLVLALFIPKVFPSMIDLYTSCQKTADAEIYAGSSDHDSGVTISDVMKDLNLTRCDLLKTPRYIMPLICGMLGYW